MDEETADPVPVLSETRNVAVKQRRKVVPEKGKAEKAASTKPKEKAEKAAPPTNPKEKADEAASTNTKEKADEAASTNTKEKADEAASTKHKEKADKAASTKHKEKADEAASTKHKEKADKAGSTKSKEKADKVAPSTKPKEKAAASVYPLKKKTVLDLVCEAIESSGENKKGASAQAIRKYVKSHYDSAAPNLDYLINKALNKGIELKKLERPPASKDAKGAIGHFRLSKLLAPKRANINLAKRLNPEEYVSDSEATEKPEKPRKRTFSDTYIEEMRVSATSTPKSSVKPTIPLKNSKQTKKAPSKKAATLKKDTSDTNLIVKKTQRKSMKSYSSDTEVDFDIQNTKIVKEPPKKAKSDKPKMEKADSTSKISKNKVKKLYDGGKENGAKNKSGKAKAKKQE